MTIDKAPSGTIGHSVWIRPMRATSGGAQRVPTTPNAPITIVSARQLGARGAGQGFEMAKIELNYSETIPFQSEIKCKAGEHSHTHGQGCYAKVQSITGGPCQSVMCKWGEEDVVPLIPAISICCLVRGWIVWGWWWWCRWCYELAMKYLDCELETNWGTKKSMAG